MSVWVRVFMYDENNIASPDVGSSDTFASEPGGPPRLSLEGQGRGSHMVWADKTTNSSMS